MAAWLSSLKPLVLDSRLRLCPCPAQVLTGRPEAAAAVGRGAFCPGCRGWVRKSFCGPEARCPQAVAPGVLHLAAPGPWLLPSPCPSPGPPPGFSGLPAQDRHSLWAAWGPGTQTWWHLPSPHTPSCRGEQVPSFCWASPPPPVLSPRCALVAVCTGPGGTGPRLLRPDRSVWVGSRHLLSRPHCSSWDVDGQARCCF